MSEQPPVLKTDAPRVEPIGDHDNSILSHLGIPFYFRHSPTRNGTRGIIWVTFFLLLIIVVLNVIQMPFAKDTAVYAIRATFFSPHPAYVTAEEGSRAICFQFFCIAIVIAGIISPLYGTYSFSSERVQGTLEFLRLSPMSTLSIVMGKMFAPGFVLLLIALAMLGIGFVFGICGSLPASKLFIAMVTIITTSAMFHALGALLAAMTVAFRGFLAVGLLLAAGWIISVAPVSARYDRGSAFLCFFSPWGTMETLFWHSNDRYGWGPQGDALYFGSESLVLPMIVFSQGLLFALLVWAASRKLERLDRPALPIPAWIALWVCLGLYCIGSVANFADPFYNNWDPAFGWRAATSLYLAGGLVLALLALLDHPHERENVLTEECEYAAGREDAPGASARRLKYALFVTLLVFASTIVFSWLLLKCSSPRFKVFTLEAALPIIGLTTLMAFIFALILECAWVRYSSFFVRWGATAVGVAVFLTALFLPIGAVNTAYYRWDQSVQAVVENLKDKESGISRARRNTSDLTWLMANPDYSIYVPQADTLEDARKVQDEFRNNPVGLFWNYHPRAALAYPAVFVALVVLLLLGRRRTYAALRREAIRAVKGSQVVPPTTILAPEPRPAESTSPPATV